MKDIQFIQYWACGLWCFVADAWEYHFMSDYFVVKEVPGTMTIEEIDFLVIKLNSPK